MNRTMKSVVAIAVIGGALLFSAESCDKASEPFHDSDRGQNNDEPADTMSFPDGFSNVAHKCDGPNMVYVIFKSDASYGSIDVVKDDPRCTS